MNNLNSFVLLTFDKTVILEVSKTGTMNLALRPDVYCIIFQLLEVLSRLKTCFFYAWMLDLLGVDSGTEDQFISETTVEKMSLRVISEHFDMPASQLLVR